MTVFGFKLWKKKDKGPNGAFKVCESCEHFEGHYSTQGGYWCCSLLRIQIYDSGGMNLVNEHRIVVGCPRRLAHMLCPGFFLDSDALSGTEDVVEKISKGEVRSIELAVKMDLEEREAERAKQARNWHKKW